MRLISAGELAGAMALLAISVAACADGPASLEPGSMLLSVSPAGGAAGVDPAAPVRVVFDHPLHDRMLSYVMLHEGTVTGNEVEGDWRLEAHGTQLVFTPAWPLQPATAFTLHLGGGMTDARGRHVDLETHGLHMGGHWATGSMMDVGSGHGHMGNGHGHMGSGWRHAGNGSYGMVFTFTTTG